MATETGDGYVALDILEPEEMRTRLADLLTEERRLNEGMEAGKERVAELRGEMRDILLAVGGKVRSPAHGVLAYTSVRTSSRLRTEWLLERGVSPDVIQRAATGPPDEVRLRELGVAEDVLQAARTGEPNREVLLALRVPAQVIAQATEVKESEPTVTIRAMAARRERA